MTRSLEKQFEEFLELYKTNNRSYRPDAFVYEYLTRVSGPQSALGTDIDMNTDSDATPSVFEYTVPTQMKLNYSRINITLVDGAMRYGQFGGTGGALSEGVKIQLMNSDNTQALDFTGGFPIKANEDFGNLAGVDSVAVAAAGDDFLPIRFSIFKAGGSMTLHGGEIIRFTIQDDISGVTKFRAMVQGVIWSDA